MDLLLRSASQEVSTVLKIANKSWHFFRYNPNFFLCNHIAGNVWFDHPAVDEVGCYSRGTVHTLRNEDRALSNPIYDWENFDRHSGVCIRLSRHGLQTLDKRKKSYVTSVSSRTHKKKDSKNTLLSHLWGI